MHLHLSRSVLAVACALAVGSAARAQLVITEVMPSGSGSAYAADWFELTNLGGSAVSITGYKVDDSSNLFASAAALTGISSVGAGESVLFLESAAGAAITGFRSHWGGLGGIQVGYYSGSGLGLSGSGDGVNLFDGGGSFVTGVSFGAGTNEVSFDNHTGAAGVISALSVAGQFGAFASTGTSSGFGGITSLGSPGAIANAAAVPEPSTYAAVFGALALGGAAWSRRRVSRAQ